MSGFERFLMAFSANLALLANVPLALADTEPNTAQNPPDAAERPFPSPDAPFRLEVLGGGAFGDTTLPTGESVNAYGPGLAIRGGYTFDFGGAIGLRYDHYFGTTSSYPVPLVALIEHQTGASYIAADLGFELTISHALFRPHLGLGMLATRKSVSCSSVSGSFDQLAADLCAQNDSSETSWGAAAVPGLVMGLGGGSILRFRGYPVLPEGRGQRLWSRRGRRSDPLALGPPRRPTLAMGKAQSACRRQAPLSCMSVA